ncbi:NAD(P)-dependent oxidoreductase, partial [bacterium]|nr:NAD(P)-dependent oxidoreductase [bacterium]
ISFHTGDVTNFVFPKGQYSHLIHAATTSAYETYRGETPLAKFDTLVCGTRRVLDFAAQCGVEQFLFTSSGVAYGGLELNPAIDESCNNAPSTIDSSTALGQGKRAAEFLCATYAEKIGFNMTIARCFSFVGPYQPLDIHYAIGNFILQAINNKTILIRGDGTPLRSFLYSGDLVTWLLTLLLRKGTTDIYNVGSDSAISINNLANLVKETTNSTSTIEIQGNPSHSTGNPLRSTYIPNISRARNELGLDVWTPLSKAILLTSEHAAFCQSNDHHQTIRL